MTQLTLKHREFGVQSMVLAAVFFATLAVAVLVDLAGLLQYAGLVGGLPTRILEIGGIISAAAIFPLVAMGMSISADMTHHK
jgi:hypothetical protein